MTRSELVKVLKEKHKGFSLEEVDAIVREVFGFMRESLLKGDRIELRGFGVFEPRTKVGYRARNPKTGDVVDVSSSKSVNFKVGKMLFNRLNQD